MRIVAAWGILFLIIAWKTKRLLVAVDRQDKYAWQYQQGNFLDVTFLIHARLRSKIFATNAGIPVM